MQKYLSAGCQEKFQRKQFAFRLFVCLLRILSKGKMRMYLRRGCLAPAYLIVTQGCIFHEWKQECGFKISHSEEHCLLIKSYVVMCL